MRELSARERAFLQSSLPDGEDGAPSEKPSSPRFRFDPKSASTRIFEMVGSILSYLPLVIGAFTLLLGAVATYIYFWGREFFKVSEVERMSADGTFNLMDKTSSGWLESTLQIFSVAPWVILATVIVGTALMGLSMILVRKRNG